MAFRRWVLTYLRDRLRPLLLEAEGELAVATAAAGPRRGSSSSIKGHSHGGCGGVWVGKLVEERA